MAKKYLRINGRATLVEWLKTGAINLKQARSLVRLTRWYKQEPKAHSIWDGVLFARWDHILVGIEKDGYAHS